MRSRIMLLILTFLFIQSTFVVKVFSEEDFSLEDLLGILDDPEKLDLFEKGLAEPSTSTIKDFKKQEDLSSFSIEELFLKNLVVSGKETVPLKQYESYLETVWEINSYLVKIETILETSKKVSSELYSRYIKLNNDITTIKLIEETEPYVRIFLSKKSETLRNEVISFLKLLREFPFSKYTGIEDDEEDEEISKVTKLALEGISDENTEKNDMDFDFGRVLDKVPEISKKLAELKKNPEIKKLTEQMSKDQESKYQQAAKKLASSVSSRSSMMNRRSPSIPRKSGMGSRNSTRKKTPNFFFPNNSSGSSFGKSKKDSTFFGRDNNKNKEKKPSKKSSSRNSQSDSENEQTRYHSPKEKKDKKEKKSKEEEVAKERAKQEKEAETKALEAIEKTRGEIITELEKEIWNDTTKNYKDEAIIKIAVKELVKKGSAFAKKLRKNKSSEQTLKNNKKLVKEKKEEKVFNEDAIELYKKTKTAVDTLLKDKPIDSEDNLKLLLEEVSLPEISVSK